VPDYPPNFFARFAFVVEIHPMNDTLHILTIAGSLRENSSTHTVLRTIESLAPAAIKFTRYEGLASLPHFDDSPEIPPAVADFRAQLRAADGVLICTPEYAFGVPGSLKNALDWTVSSGEFVGKPVAVITAATQGENAHASLLLTLSALSAKVPNASTLLIPFIRSKIDKARTITDPEIRANFTRAIQSLIQTIREQ
jgi:NAD(P)H-dependent FMN reductase